MTSYFYVRDGEQVGPVTTAQLKELAANGGLDPEDLVWQEGLPDWKPARKFAGLFPAPAAAAPPPPPMPPPVAGHDADFLEDAPPPLPPAPPLPGGQWDESTPVRAALGRCGRMLGIEVPTLIAIGAGVGCLVLLMLSTLLTWSGGSFDMNFLGAMKMQDSESEMGLERFEGIFVFVLVLLTAVLLGAGAVLRRFLPAAVVAATGTMTLSTLLTLSYMTQVSRAVADLRELLKKQYGFMQQNPFMKEAAKSTDFQFSFGLGAGAYLALFAALGATAAFATAAVFKPQPLSFLEAADVPPLVRRYGALLATVVVAFMLGAILWVSRLNNMVGEV